MLHGNKFLCIEGWRYIPRHRAGMQCKKQGPTGRIVRHRSEGSHHEHQHRHPALRYKIWRIDDYDVAGGESLVLPSFSVLLSYGLVWEYNEFEKR